MPVDRTLNGVYLPPVEGQRVLVVGSAPGLWFPDPRDVDVVMGANGGAALAYQYGFDVPYLVTTVRLFVGGDGTEARGPLPSQAELATRRMLAGLKFRNVWMDECDGTLAAGSLAMRGANVSYGTAHGVLPEQRDTITERACGLCLGSGPNRISTGMFAVCLAFVAGAERVILAGFSVRDGHTGMPWDTAPRHHKEPDLRCIERLREDGRLEEINAHD